MPLALTSRNKTTGCRASLTLPSYAQWVTLSSLEYPQPSHSPPFLGLLCCPPSMSSPFLHLSLSHLSLFVPDPRFLPHMQMNAPVTSVVPLTKFFCPLKFFFLTRDHANFPWNFFSLSLSLFSRNHFNRFSIRIFKISTVKISTSTIHYFAFQMFQCFYFSYFVNGQNLPIDKINYRN